MQFGMQIQIVESIGFMLDRHGVHAHGQLDQLSPFFRSRGVGEESGGLRLQCFAYQIVAADIFPAGNPDARTGARAALQQTFKFQP
jgi:hypothetical protein